MKKEKFFWGIFFIAAAVLLIASKLGFASNISFFSIIISIVFVATLIKSLFYRSVSGVLFSIAFLIIIHAKLLGLEEITPWPVLGAALLGSIGVSFFYHPKRKYFHHDQWIKGETVETIVDNDMEFKTSFGSSIKYVNSDDFKSARIDCSFGGMKVYFDNAMIQNNQAVLQIQASFSGVELYIPKEWAVIDQLSCSFGGLEEKNRSQTNGSPRVVLTGSISFSGVTIIYI